MSPARLLAAFLVLSAFVASPSLAQTVDLDPTVSLVTKPNPGYGHDYIKMLTETVNPANGSVSVRIEAPMPSQRGDVNFPFYIFAYDTTGISVPEATISWGTTLYGTPLAFLGVQWKDSSTVISSQAGGVGAIPGGFVANAVVGRTGNGFTSLNTVISSSPQVNAICSYTYPYTFTDPTGTNHTLNLMHITQNGGGANEGCSFYGLPQSDITYDSDAQYQAGLLPNTGRG